MKHATDSTEHPVWSWLDRHDRGLELAANTINFLLAVAGVLTLAIIVWSQTR